MSSLKCYRTLISITVFICCVFPLHVLGQEIDNLSVKTGNDTIVVSFSLSLNHKSVQEIKQGMDKEMRFYIDLFRVWKVWPDEFVIGKQYLRTLKSDPIKKEHVASSNDGSVIIEKRFKSLESMLDWTMSVKDLKLTHTNDLEPGSYYIKVTIESRVRNLPPVIGYLFIFLPENEFKIKEKSSLFLLEGRK